MTDLPETHPQDRGAPVGTTRPAKGKATKNVHERIEVWVNEGGAGGEVVR